MSVLWKRGTGRRPLLPGMRTQPRGAARRAARRHRPLRRPRGLHHALGDRRSRAGQAPRRRAASSASSRHHHLRRAGRQDRRRRASSPSSARRSPTRTTPSGRCAPRCGCGDARATRTRARGAIHLRVGVNTGEVLVGALRAGGDYTAMGDVVNTASRLQTAARPDQVVRRSRHLRRGASAASGTRRSDRSPSRVAKSPCAAWLAVRAVAPRATGTGESRHPSSAARRGRGAPHGARHAATRERAHLVLADRRRGVGKSRIASELGKIAECEHGRAGAQRPLRSLRRDERVVADRGHGRRRVRSRPHRSRGPRPRVHRHGRVQGGLRWSTTTRRSAGSPTVSCISWRSRSRRGRRSGTRPRGRAAAPRRRSSAGWRTVNRWSSSSRTCTGPTSQVLELLAAPAHPSLECAVASSSAPPARAHRPVDTTRGTPQHRARQPRPARQR